MSISIRHEMIDNFYRTISPALITRFKEREENVKSDIFHAYIALLRQTKPVTGIAAPDPASMEAEEGPVSLLQAQVNLLTMAVKYNQIMLLLCLGGEYCEGAAPPDEGEVHQDPSRLLRFAH